MHVTQSTGRESIRLRPGLMPRSGAAQPRQSLESEVLAGDVTVEGSTYVVVRLDLRHS